MRTVSPSLPRIDDSVLDGVTGGMISRFPWNSLVRTTHLNRDDDPYLRPGGIRDQQLAAGQARFDALVKANPGILGPPDPNHSVHMLQHRLATGYGKPHVVRN